MKFLIAIAASVATIATAQDCVTQTSTKGCTYTVSLPNSVNPFGSLLGAPTGKVNATTFDDTLAYFTKDMTANTLNCTTAPNPYGPSGYKSYYCLSVEWLYMGAFKAANASAINACNGGAAPKIQGIENTGSYTLPVCKADCTKVSTNQHNYIVGLSCIGYNATKFNVTDSCKNFNDTSCVALTYDSAASTAGVSIFASAVVALGLLLI